MKNLLGFIFILLVFLFLYFCVHIYIAKFISQASFVKNKVLIKKIFVLLSLFSFLSLVFRTKFNNTFLEYIYVISLFWIGSVVITVSFCLIGDIVIIILKTINKNIVIYCAIVLSTFSILFASYRANIIPQIKELNINLKNLASNVLRIIFIADTHFDFRYKNKTALKIFQRIEQLHPDFLIIGGDFLDPGFVLDNYILRIKNFKIKTIIVFGNHEYYFGLSQAEKIFENLNFIVLKNSSIIIDGINFIGLGDIRTENLSKQKVLEIVANNYKNGYLNIIISHQPLYFKEISENFDVIMLSGHTHKGQIFPFHIFTRLAYKYFYGLYKNKNSYLYVTSGTGVWGPPMRFFADSEIVNINLVKK